MMNAVITDTFFEIDYFGITCSLTFYDGEKRYKSKALYYGEEGLNMLFKMLTTIGVSDIKELKGKPCRISLNEDNLIKHIHHFIEDKGIDIIK